jgi:uncharacterized membrane protein YdjX (TVP38/TMEM64 family)
MGRRARIATSVLFALAIVSVVALVLRNREALASLIEWIRHAGGIGLALFVALYVLGVVLLLPSVAFAASAGYVFGAAGGMAVALPASLLASASAFLVGRHLARVWLAERLTRSARFVAIDRAVGTHGLRLVVLLRISAFLPHNLINYLLAITCLRLRDFVLGSLIGTLPVVIFQAYAGSVAPTAADILAGRRPDLGTWPYAVTGFGVLATITVMVLLARTARRELQRLMAETPVLTEVERSAL